MKIGLIGIGNIGLFLLRSINLQNIVPGSRIDAVFDARNTDLDLNQYRVQAYPDFPSFLTADTDLVIEAANVEAAAQYAAEILNHGKNMIMVSVGALADNELYEQLQTICRNNGVKIHLPSGAIGGLDALKSGMALQPLHSVQITTRKPPKSLSLDYLDQERVIFEGSATDAIREFPRNVNVSVILGLAGLGCDQTQVQIIADPTVVKNMHTIQASGSFGKMKFEIENDPMPDNPKTSYLAALSVLAALKKQSETITIS